MATRKSKNGDDEKLSSANIEHVIKLLEPTDGSKRISKKDACSILNIAYNTTRLASIIDKYKEKKEADHRRRAEKRGKPATPAEISYIISSYLEGQAVENISSGVYRSAVFVRSILDHYNVPIRARAHDYFKPELIPEGAMKERFKIGEKVYSAQYDSMVQICAEQEHKDYGWVYRVWLSSDKWQQYAYVPACELASLEHLKEAGVPV